ncbi:hypothetical protein DER45DRAFT_614993 [Fusarium avenaceum]|nr:hypothetical protein DER45DRAFT_614993 [Fusarium avenaceum]
MDSSPESNSSTDSIQTSLATLAFRVRDGNNLNSIQTVRVELHDMKSTSLPEAYDESGHTWITHGIRVIKMRHHASQGFDHGGKVLDHVESIARCLRSSMDLQMTPVCLDAEIIYGITNPTSAHMDVSHVGPITVSVGQDIPSSMVKMALTKSTAEILLRRLFGNEMFTCLAAGHAGWEILEVSHPLTTAMRNYPHMVCDPRTLVPSRDFHDETSVSGGPGATRHVMHHESQSWMQLFAQQPFEMLVRRVASSDERNDVIVPLVSGNITGDPFAQPEDRMTVRFVAWKPRT